ncbi:MAG TPA: DUF2163 domain-containing protein [Rhizobiaceae bacterium]|nr:DUF2163 domain-containing protein [Rhizobiaceae bacterium]
MTAYPAPLLAHMAKAATSLCHCWRLTRKDGAVSGFTDHDRPLTVDGTLCEPSSGFSASEARDTLGLATDTVDVEGALSSEKIRDEDVAAGLYDGATIETFLVNWQQPSQAALIRTATVGKITRSDHRFIAELESLASALDRPAGRYVRKTCDAELGDARCGFALAGAAFVGTGTVAEVTGPGAIRATDLGGYAAGWFSFGTVEWTSGANNGRVARVLMHAKKGADVTLTLWPGSWAAPETGDTFSIKAGCDKRFATCKTKFDNALNFRGFPHLPGNDQGYSYVIDGGVFDGGAVVL